MKEKVNKRIYSRESLITESSVGISSKVQLLTMTAIFAAFITITTAYVFHIPVPITGGYIHVGDSLIYLAACFLPTPYAMVAAAIGGGMADLLTAPMWTLPTVIIKMLIVLPFTCKSKKIVTTRNMLATLIAFVISATGYYLANTVIFGCEIAFLSSLFGSSIQSGGSAILFIVLGLALDNIKIKSKIYR